MSKVRHIKIFAAVIILLIIAGVISLPSCKPDQADPELNQIRADFSLFIKKTETLKARLQNFSGDSLSRQTALQALKECRLQYKRVAFFIDYFFPEEANVCNGPPQPEIEGGQEFKDPTGLQVIESLLYSNDFRAHKEQLVTQADAIIRSCSNLQPSLENFSMDEEDVLASVNLELIRVITLYITGYDAPKLKSGIEEAAESLDATAAMISRSIKDGTKKTDIIDYFTQGKKYLESRSDFDSFDRLYFLTKIALPLQHQLNGLMLAGNFHYHHRVPLNASANNLFSSDAFNKNSFPSGNTPANSLLVDLGKQLFSETRLSGKNNRSCASCHNPNDYFTDRLPRNKTLSNENLPRNTPSLIYSVYQYAQFWDGRVQSLEDQIHDVVNNQREMSGSAEVIITRLSHDPHYAATFKQIWPQDSSITFSHAAIALAAFIRTLTPFHSAFDSYINGDHAALSQSQQSGFNLFMGKAKCGSCHFAPLFNGLLPPEYANTEFEILGTTADDNFKSPREDSDQGRFDFFPSPLYKQAFKTPTVRNSAVTAPYMHNGGFKSLKTVIEFYDKGGGAAFGFHVPNQTLDETPLHLTDQEKLDIKAFLESLTDK